MIRRILVVVTIAAIVLRVFPGVGPWIHEATRPDYQTLQNVAPLFEPYGNQPVVVDPAAEVQGLPSSEQIWRRLESVAGRDAR